jgi:hypothetical protein
MIRTGLAFYALYRYHKGRFDVDAGDQAHMWVKTRKAFLPRKMTRQEWWIRELPKRVAEKEPNSNIQPLVRLLDPIASSMVSERKQGSPTNKHEDDKPSAALIHKLIDRSGEFDKARLTYVDAAEIVACLQTLELLEAEKRQKNDSPTA